MTEQNKLTYRPSHRPAKSSHINWPKAAGAILLILATTFGVGRYALATDTETKMDIMREFLTNFATEFFSIAVTVLIIDTLYRRREKQWNNGELKNALIMQLNHPDNVSAIEAVRQLRVKGWLTDGSLCGAELNGAKFSGADLVEAKLSGAKLIRAELNGAAFSNADLSKVNLFGAELIGAFLNGANLAGANLFGANLSEVQLINATLCGARLDKAKLIEANLLVADLSQASLKGVDLSGADLRGADLNGTKYDNQTDWPDGFDPAAAGAILVKD